MIQVYITNQVLLSIYSSECLSDYVYYAGVGCLKILLMHEQDNYTDAKQACNDTGGWLATRQRMMLSMIMSCMLGKQQVSKALDNSSSGIGNSHCSGDGGGGSVKVKIQKTNLKLGHK